MGRDLNFVLVLDSQNGSMILLLFIFLLLVMPMHYSAINTVQPIVINTWSFVNATRSAFERMMLQNGTCLDGVEAGCRTCEEKQCGKSVGWGDRPAEDGDRRRTQRDHEHSPCKGVRSEWRQDNRYYWLLWTCGKLRSINILYVDIISHLARSVPWPPLLGLSAGGRASVGA